MFKWEPASQLALESQSLDPNEALEQSDVILNDSVALRLAGWRILQDNPGPEPVRELLAQGLDGPSPSHFMMKGGLSPIRESPFAMRSTVPPSAAPFSGTANARMARDGWSFTTNNFSSSPMLESSRRRNA